MRTNVEYPVDDEAISKKLTNAGFHTILVRPMDDATLLQHIGPPYVMPDDGAILNGRVSIVSHRRATQEALFFVFEKFPQDGAELWERIGTYSHPLNEAIALAVKTLVYRGLTEGR